MFQKWLRWIEMTHQLQAQPLLPACKESRTPGARWLDHRAILDAVSCVVVKTCWVLAWRVLHKISRKYT
jgi:hypothetical protein